MEKLLSDEEERVGKMIVNSAFTVHNALGPGLLEKVYEVCLCHELKKSALNEERQLDIPIVYDGITSEVGLRFDLLAENKAVIELKAVDIINPVWEAQIISHLMLTGRRLGYLINFNVSLIKDGTRRNVNTKQSFAS